MQTKDCFKHYFKISELKNCYTMLKWKVEKKFEHGSKILSPTSKTGKFMSALMSETHLTLWQDALETLISDPTKKRANNFFSTKNLIFFLFKFLAHVPLMSQQLPRSVIQKQTKHCFLSEKCAIVFDCCKNARN